MGGFSISSFLKLGLSVSLLVVSLLITACGNKVAAPPAGVSGPTLQVLGVATPGKDLSKSWKKDGVPEASTCFKVANDGSALNKLYAYNAACEALSPAAKAFAVLEAREWINPEKIGEPTGQYILYSQLLPVGELRLNGGEWSLEDLCQVDSFYQSACELTVVDNTVTALELNPVAVAERVRLQKLLESENDGLRLDLEKSDEGLKKLNALLAKLSVQLQSQKDGVQAVIASFEPVLQKEELRVNEILIGKKGQAGTGVEARLASIALEVRELTAALESVQKETGEVTVAYLGKMQEIKDSEKALEKLYADRSEAKKKVASSDSEEKVQAAQDELNKVNTAIGESALVIADKKDEAAVLLAAVKSHPSYEKEQEAAKKLAAAKKASGEALDRVALVRAKLNAVQVAKSHVATASKLLRENKIGEAAMVLPSLGKFVDRAVSIVL